MNIQNYINHIVLVLDASDSMHHRSEDLIKVADNQIEYLAQRSKDLDQETRVTVYSFSDFDNIKCLIYDKDVLRMPSIAGLYESKGNTALIDATFLALEDLQQTSEKYGEHAFLIYVLTDGQENDSRKSPATLSVKIGNLPDNWTLAAFVPDQAGVFEAKKFGFPPQNIAVWNANTSVGISEAGARIRETTETFMQNRVRGITGSRNLFSLSTPTLTAVENNLEGLHPGQYRILDVEDDERIDEFVEFELGRAYKRGEAYYELMKPETIQPQKQIVIMAKNKAFVGDNARKMLGLPDYSVKVEPTKYPDYKIFVQSTSVNRKLIGGTKLLILS